MKRFTALFAACIALICGIFIIANIFVNNSNSQTSGQYRVEVNRIVYDIDENGYEKLDLQQYPHINAVTLYKESMGTDFYNSASDYMIREIDGKLYRIDYTINFSNKDTLLALNISLGIMTAIVIAIFVYTRQKILKPFNKISNVPYELSKGNLSEPIKEQKGKYFGKFVWGIDLLRERLEDNKEKELKLQKDKRTLLLSLSHDIKTPLGVIELYAKALEKNLYKDEQKQKQIAASITEKCSEITAYISEITSTINEDFLDFKVNIQEVYLSEIIDSIRSFYTEKMELLKINFTIREHINCLLSADIDRSVEVLQNIIENAIKYGDGKEINISFTQEDDCMLVTISNSGCELSENELPHIFDSFWRGSNTGSKSGSGMGLYICRKLMQAMNGEVFANIKNSTMYVTTVFPMV